MLGVPKGILNGAVKSGSGHTPKTPFHLGWHRECQYLRGKVSEQRINLVHPQVQPLTIDPSWYEVEQLTTLHAATKLSYQTKPNLQELRTAIGMVHCPGLKLCIRNVHSIKTAHKRGNSERSGKRWQRTYPQKAIYLGWHRECQYLRGKVSGQRINLVHPQVRHLKIDPSWYEVKQRATLRATIKPSYV
jgi:hypothetical protein